MARLPPALPRLAGATIATVAGMSPAALAQSPVLPGGNAAEARTAIVRSVTAEIERRFQAGGRYVMGPFDGTGYRYCNTAGPELRSAPLIAPVAALLENSPGGARGAGLRSNGPSAGLLLECRYPMVTSGGRGVGWVVVVASTPANLAERIVGACAAVLASVRNCAWRMLAATGQQPWGSNNLIFPVAGFVAEPCPSGGHGLIGFRYGVGVRFAAAGPASKEGLDFCVTRPLPVEHQRRVALEQPLALVRPVARLAALSRHDLARHEPAPAAAGATPFEPLMAGRLIDAYQRFVIENEACAATTGYDRMMALKAALNEGRPVPAVRPCPAPADTVTDPAGARH